MKIGKTTITKIILLFITLFLSVLISIFIFPTMVDFSMEKNRLFHILLNIRLPEIMIAITAGGCLGLAGAIMQIILDNSLASPFTLGISAASAFGAAVSIFMELNLGILWLRPETTAFACALVSVALLVLFSTLSRTTKKILFLLV